MVASEPTLPEHTGVVEVQRTTRTLILRARRRADQLPVVLKSVAPGCNDPTAGRRLSDEFSILRDLNFDGVVRAHRLLATPQGPVLEMEDLGQTTLQDQTTPLPIDRILEVGVALTTALVKVHAAGVLHLDVSPTNIAIDPATGRVTLLDFSAGRRVEGRAARPAADGALGGTLGYWAPEQTGRLAVSVDRRTDLFSVGAVLYRLLVGVAPGPTDDMLRAVHAALALVPPAPSLLRAEVPEAISQIMMKLLEKVADDRYRGAHGVLHDLLRSRAALAANGTVSVFALGEQDVPEVFTPSRRLYGRDAPLAALQSWLVDAATSASHAAIAIVGPSGVGKSALVAEAARRFSIRGAQVASGQADHARGRPLAVLLEALTAAIRARLGLPEATLAQIRARARAAVSEAGPAVLDIVPGLQALAGELAPVADLAPAEALNRTAAAEKVRFAAARNAYAAGRFDEARTALGQCLEACPADQAAQVLRARCERFLREGPPDGWDGAYRLTVK